MGLLELRNSGWKTTLTLSELRLNSWTRRIWFRMGSLASSAMLCVVTGGSEFRLRANTRRLRRMISSDDKSLSASGTSVPCSLPRGQSVVPLTMPVRVEGKDVPRVPESVLEDPLANLFSDLVDSLLELGSDGLTLERLDSVRVGGSRHDDEGDNGRLGSHRLQTAVQSCGTSVAVTQPSRITKPGLTSEGLDEHVDTLVSELVSTSSEHVDGVFEVKVVVAVKVTSDEVVDLFLGLDVQVLELVHGRKLLDVETVRQDSIYHQGQLCLSPHGNRGDWLLTRLSLEKVLRLESGNVRDGGKDIGAVGGRSLNAVSATVSYALLKGEATRVEQGLTGGRYPSCRPRGRRQSTAGCCKSRRCRRRGIDQAG